MKKQKVFKCKYCDQTFPLKQSLGGHTSKAHPNMSVAYKKRVMNKVKKSAMNSAKQNSENNTNIPISGSTFEIFK